MGQNKHAWRSEHEHAVIPLTLAFCSDIELPAAPASGTMCPKPCSSCGAKPRLVLVNHKTFNPSKLRPRPRLKGIAQLPSSQTIQITSPLLP